LRLFTTAHPVGTRAAAYFLANGFPKEKIFFFPYLIDEALLKRLYRLASERRHDLRAEYGIGDDDFVVLGVMKFVPREDPLTLLNSVARVLKSESSLSPVRKTHLVMVGDGVLRTEMKKIIEAQSIPNVYFPGYVSYSSLPSFFALADIFVHPAKQESWGVTVNEAIVCGLPVVAANSVGASDDLIVNGVNGLTFPAGDTNALVEILSVLRDRPELVESLRDRCHSPARLAVFSYASTEVRLGEAIRAANSTLGAGREA
jgi:glycosyltransferase involved in cell wall biosynthesis